MPDHCAGAGIEPLLSPGKRSPVGSATPNFFRYEYNVGPPIRCAALMVPMLLDRARIPASVSRSVPCGSESWNRWSDTCIVPGTRNLDIGPAFFWSTTAAIVITLLVEPGS